VSTPLSSKNRAELSRGISGGDWYYEFAIRGFEQTLPGSSVLDLGCGTGSFGAFLHARLGIRPQGVDIVRHEGFAETHYSSFQLADLDTDAISGGHDFIFALGVIEYLTHPRRFLRAAAALLRPGGRLVITSPNPASLRSLLSLLRHGECSAFKESSNPASITPVLAVDAARMLREASLTEVQISFSGHGRIPGAGGLRWQRLLPGARGRWFSDDFRVTGR
jgi:2-polyprenyl-3-methyl-5-hydroxy-6-metoxy-1,4-benzoquinol methylase